KRTIDAREQALCDRISIRNFGPNRVDLPLSLSWDAGFEDVFEVRGMNAEHRGTLLPPAWRNGVLTFVYEGADHVERRLSIDCEPRPAETDGSTAHLLLTIEPETTADVVIVLRITESEPEHAERARRKPRERRTPDVEATRRDLADSAARWLATHTQMT